MVIAIAITASLNASRRPLLMLGSSHLTIEYADQHIRVSKIPKDVSILVGFPRTCQGPPQPAADTNTDRHNPIMAAMVENIPPAPFLAWGAGDG